MKVKLISYTQPTEEFREQCGAKDIQDLIVYCARVSNPNNQSNFETSEKLLNYLIKNAHWSPFEMANAVLEIETTRDIARQLLRHRSCAFQEFCVSGDTEIYFAIPKKLKSGSYTPTSKIKISDLYDKWENGASPIQTKSGQSMRIPLKDRLKNMHIKFYDDVNDCLSTTSIKEVFKTGIKPLYKITLSDGKSIKTTKEHKFLTKDGFDSLENIIQLQMINNKAVMGIKNPIIGVNGIYPYQDKDWLLARKNESLFVGGGIPWICNTYGFNYNTIRKWLKIHGIQYTKKESAITYDVWNKNKYGYTIKPVSEETRRKQRESALARGEAHNWYRGGKSRQRESLNGVDVKLFKESKGYMCEKCSATNTMLDVHHVIPVSIDPTKCHDVNNWQLLCRNCHIAHHKENNDPGWHSMWAKKAKINTQNKNKLVKWVSIKSVEYVGEDMTYDIEVEHNSHNYIANGIITHNSQRYADPTKELNFVYRDARFQDTKNRQNSVDLDLTNPDHRELNNLWVEKQQEIIRLVKESYTWAVTNGIAKEQARAILPEGNTVSRLYANNTIRGWLHYCEVRTDPSTQKEHRELAHAIAIEIAKAISFFNKFN